MSLFQVLKTMLKTIVIQNTLPAWHDKCKMNVFGVKAFIELSDLYDQVCSSGLYIYIFQKRFFIGIYSSTKNL